MLETKVSKAEARKTKTALALSVQLEKSVKAMRAFCAACADCDDTKVLNADDGRQLLRASMDEYSCWLARAYGTN